MRRVLLTAGVVLVLAPSAQAAWSPPDIVSVDNARREQADSATLQVQIADDGRFVVFQARATNFFADDDPDPPQGARQGGIFRYDRANGSIAKVADGDVVAPDGTLVVRGAANPSISANGRFVAFSTAQKLVPADTNDNVDVYVRDLDSGAFELIDARDGSDVPATYAPRTPPAPGDTPGAAVAPGTSISSDGRFVAFRTTEQASDLPAQAATTTPGGNLFVRDRSLKRTTLVTRRSADGGPAGGAGAAFALSRDGSTVGWTGQSAPSQTRFVSGEVTDDSAYFYLWRRWDDAGAATRRVTGLADPDDPGCGTGDRVDTGTTATGPCEGPLTDTEQGNQSIQSLAPALSGDGYRVAFLASGALRPQASFNPGLDLFVTDMHPGVSRKAGTQELTRDPTSGSPRAGGPIDAVSLSADGQHVLFATARSAFLLPDPRFVDTERQSAGGDDLYSLDLRTRTFDRVVRSAAGGDQDGGVLSRLSQTSDGTTAAYLSNSGDLIAGDANGVVDAFTTSLAPPPVPPPAPAAASRRPANLSVTSTSAPTLQLSPKRRSDGGIDLRVTAPALGRVAVAVTAGKARVGTVRKKVPASRKLTVALKPSGARKRSVARGRTIKLRIVVTFTPATGRAVKRSLTATFAKKKKKAAAKKRSGERLENAR